jgi:glycosylphosphatidylinositol transamidase
VIGRARAVSGAMAPRDAVIAGIGRVFRHHRRVSAVLYVVGVLGVLSYPLLARRVFIDENAFLHGHGAIGFGADEALWAHEYALKAEGVIDAWVRTRMETRYTTRSPISPQTSWTRSAWM